MSQPKLAEPESEALNCFHCGLPVREPGFGVVIKQQRQIMCCAGCEAVAQAIVDAGMTHYYEFREGETETGRELVPEFLQQLSVYDNPGLQKRFVHQLSEQQRSVSLILEGISCAACIWLNEQYLRSLPGIVSVQINYSTHRAQVDWNEQEISLSEILEAVARIGYRAHPYDPARQQQIFEKQRKTLIRQLGISGLFGMQVMMFAFALYGGDWWGMSADFQQFFRWLSLLLTLPVMFYSAQPFFRGAWKDLQRQSLGMDVPVTLGISLAFSASLWHTWIGSGEIYYESVCMFTFLLLGVRLFDLGARKKSVEQIEQMTALRPDMALLLDAEGQTKAIPSSELEVGDRVLVRPGESIPADGVLLSQQAWVDEALLTGESRPLLKQTGDRLIGGGSNREQALKMQITHVGQDTVLAAITRLMESAQMHKPPVALLADQVAKWFVLGVLLLVSLTALLWLWMDPDRALSIAIATLVVTCPCALSMATPAALSAAIGRLSRSGILVAKPAATEKLPQVQRLLVDKTGTLTTGQFRLQHTHQLADLESKQVLELAAALEAHSSHPLAQAFSNIDTEIELQQIEHLAGRGVAAQYQQQILRIGNRNWMQELAIPVPELQLQQSDAQSLYLALERQVIAVFEVADQLRADAPEAIRQLQQLGWQVEILSGDQKTQVQRVAAQCGIIEFQAELLPEQKLEVLRHYQQKGITVAMLGDGVNDAPVLAAADLSLAMGGGTDLASASADIIINSERLMAVVDAVSISQRMRGVIRQNFAWAIGYNLLAVPFAMAGLVPPWLAALGMSLSSLIVVLNALRLRRAPR